jgi:hypothetical protein
MEQIYLSNWSRIVQVAILLLEFVDLDVAHTHVTTMIIHICDIILLVFDPSFHDFC